MSVLKLVVKIKSLLMQSNLHEKISLSILRQRYLITTQKRIIVGSSLKWSIQTLTTSKMVHKILEAAENRE